MTSPIALALLLVLGASSVTAFQSVAPKARTSSFTSSASSMSLVPDHHMVHSTLEASSAFSFLADAAAATADLSTTTAVDTTTSMTEAVQNVAEATEQIAQDEGWWRAYLSIFETGLLTIHDTIDGPLRANGITQTWGISIAIFTASVRSLLIPLSLQQSKSSEYVKALKPYMSEIREKFKDNKDAQNRAIAKLYEDAQQNPLSGCLVSLAQLPIFLGLYRGVRLLAQDGQLKEPFLWIPSLEGPVTAPDFRGLDWLVEDWTKVDGNWVPHLGWETTLAFLVMPIVLVMGQALTMSVLSPPIDDSMGEEEKEQMEKSQVVLKFLPLLIGFFSLQVPAGLTIYWFTSNGFTLMQSLAVRAYYKANPPQIELPDYWDALEDLDSMSSDDKRKAAEAGIAVGPKFSEMVDEAKFHLIVERKPLRKESAAWKRIAEEDSLEIPTEFKAWVGGDTSLPKKREELETAEAST